MPLDHQESQPSGYNQSNWMGMGGYSQAGHQPSMSPMQDFPGFDYHQTPIPMEPAYSMPRPPPYAATHPQLPPPLIMPHNAMWPSMLASQARPTYQTPILPAGPIQTPVSAGTGSDVTPTSAKTTTSRRKLTDDERRQMCIEAEQNPNMKQTQIGAKFNVERSTVSKILRQRDKYMNQAPKEETSSPSKKSKAKLPDFEKTLTNWVRNQQKKGLPVTDEELRKQAQVFSFSRSDQALLSSATWLEKFKQKNHLIPQANGLENGDATLVDSSATSLSETPMDDSPISSNGLVSPPISAMDELGPGAMVMRDDEDDDGEGGPEEEYFNFEEKDAYSQAPAMDAVLGPDLDQSLSHAILSPMSPGAGRDEHLGHPVEGGLEDVSADSASSSSRQRSQTFHVGTSSRPPSAGRKTPAIPVRSMTSNAIEPRPTAIDPRQMMKRHKSVPDIHDTDPVRFSSMQPPPLPKSAETSPISNPGHLAEDDNIRALHAIKKLLQQHPNVAEPDDYLAIGKLMSKLKLLRSPSTTPTLPGGMHPVDILESPRISKKRTILGIST